MLHQFYAAALDIDQDVPNGLVARAQGRLSDMESSEGQYLGINRLVFLAAEYSINRYKDADFLDDQGVVLSGALYELVEL